MAVALSFLAPRKKKLIWAFKLCYANAVMASHAAKYARASPQCSAAMVVHVHIFACFHVARHAFHVATNPSMTRGAFLASESVRLRLRDTPAFYECMLYTICIPYILHKHLWFSPTMASIFRRVSTQKFDFAGGMRVGCFISVFNIWQSIHPVCQPAASRVRRVSMVIVAEIGFECGMCIIYGAQHVCGVLHVMWTKWMAFKANQAIVMHTRYMKIIRRIS